MNITAKQTGGNEKALFHDSYPSSFTVRQRYNSSGQPTVQTDASGRELYRTVGTTPMGQTERFTLGGVLESTLEYDTVRHLLAGMKTKKGSTTVQNLLCTYDAFCNLATRKDVSRNMEEAFVYDDMDRLTEVSLGGVRTGFSTYDALGRMTAKGAGGRSVFSNAVYNLTPKPHALDKAVTASGLFPSTPQTVSYTGFDKVGKVKMGNDSLVYTYGYGHQRIAMEEHAGNTVRTKRYVGACERVTETMGSLTTDRWLTYLSGPTGVYAVVVTMNGTNTLRYILKDNLGSWTTITDSDGVVEQRLSYDAWGNLRDPNTWSGSFTGTPMFDRGFTGHEHLYNFGLINMNGRMYDPMMSSFLSVDRYVQDPTSAQGFNRYSYCMYNPLRFVDPTGWYMGAPISKAGLIREYLSDPCYITRQQLREAGMYDIEGGYGWSGGYGAMSAGWMEGDGSFHSTEWGIQTEGGGFEAGAWAIPTSFNPMWVNECQGYCNYGDQNYEYGNSSPTSHATLVTGSGRGGGRSLGLSHHIKAGFQEIISSYIIRYEISNLALGSKIASYAGSDFNKKMFWNYWLGKGDYELSSSEFEDMVSLSNIQINDVRPSEWNGNPAFAVPVSLYGTIYENAIGRTTLYYDLNGNAIGIHELYDFNLFPIRESTSAQIKTTLVRGASLYNVHSKEFYINYNYYP